MRVGHRRELGKHCGADEKAHDLIHQYHPPVARGGRSIDHGFLLPSQHSLLHHEGPETCISDIQKRTLDQVHAVPHKLHRSRPHSGYLVDYYAGDVEVPVHLLPDQGVTAV